MAGWLKKLREDKRELLRCAADAEKIAHYTLTYHPGISEIALVPSGRAALIQPTGAVRRSNRSTSLCKSSSNFLMSFARDFPVVSRPVGHIKLLQISVRYLLIQFNRFV